MDIKRKAFIILLLVGTILSLCSCSKIVYEEYVDITVSINAAYYTKRNRYTPEHGEVYVQYQDYEYRLEGAKVGKAFLNRVGQEVPAVMWRVTLDDNRVIWKVVEIDGVEVPKIDSFGREFIIEGDSILEAQYDTEID